jgi:hypothetical protein
MADSIKDFQFVVRVLESVKTREQMTTTERLFKNFKDKWVYKLDSIDMIEYIYQFNDRKKELVKNNKLFQ